MKSMASYLSVALTAGALAVPATSFGADAPTPTSDVLAVSNPSAPVSAPASSSATEPVVDLTAPPPESEEVPDATTTITAPRLPGDQFCLSVSKQCFTFAPVNPERPVPWRLDLAPPDIVNLIPRNELTAELPDPFELREVEESETVQIEGARQSVYIAPGLLAIPWAVRHPTQAWRIFLPIPADQAK